MTVVISGDTGISPVTAAGTSALVDGMTVGRGAGEVSTNTAVGASALGGNTATPTGTGNSVFGYRAGYNITSGGAVDAFGGNALFSNTTGNNIAAFGFGALYSNTTGAFNIAVGRDSLYSNTTASNNTAVGYQAGYANTVGTANVFVGQVSGRQTTGSYNTFVGDTSGYNASSGTFNAFFGQGSGYLVTTGAKNTIVGSYSGNQGGLDIRTASNYIVLSDGDGNPRGYFDNAGSIFVPRTYLDTTASAANMFITSAGQYARSTSALKYKQDIRDVENFDIGLLRPVRYKSKCEGDDQTKDHLGLIADEAAEAGFEELVTRGADGEVEGFQYERLTVVLLKKLQVLESEFKAYKEAHP